MNIYLIIGGIIILFILFSIFYYYSSGSNILLFIKPDCPNCEKMINVIKKEGTEKFFNIIDTTTKSGMAHATEKGITHVPTFLSEANKTAVIGFRNSTDQVFKELEELKGKNVQSQSPQSSDNGMILMFYRDSCKYCKQAKDVLSKSPLGKNFLQISSDSSEAKDLIQKYSLKISGVPFFYNPSTKKSMSGLPPPDSPQSPDPPQVVIDKLIKTLS